jgi:type I restriction enzyme M protein
MKSTESSPLGSRIASVHNGSSLFTGDAGSGESNIRCYIIENDMLDTIVQLPNNLFYNTGITTYIWLLNNNKPEARQGKVQLIDASLLFKKLRKNLGNKNCEFSSEHISQITQTYLDTASIDRKLNDQGDAAGIAAKVFNNDDFGYYKVNIERPDRRKAQFKTELIEPLRFDKTLREPMEHLYAEYGEDVYKADFFSANDKAKEKEILSWCEDNDISLNAKAKAKLLSNDTWENSRLLVALANKLGEAITKEYRDFNLFKKDVEAHFKTISDDVLATIKSGKRKAFCTTVMNAVSWYDESAEKVIKKVVKFKQEKLDELLHHLDCAETDLADFGFYPVMVKGKAKKLEYTTFESNSDLRDAESVPLTYLNDKASGGSDNQSAIQQYFLDEVQPHVSESWINLDSTKIGYEISFNKYFYQHKQFRSLGEVANDITSLERQAEGLIAQILGGDIEQVEG